ncbi:CDP-diacylglycerol--serine O-phosphatidyltransferase [Porphyromonas loveana]|uniref:CDP-diacylglycerol--serine O-phosphatidyltransferase n=1 Tax=Porphyromonas loveana TaxID=1884669 RepID=UPI0035A081D5
MQIRKHIPNIVTCLNLLAGCAAIIAAIEYGDLRWAAGFIVLAAVFDFFDGMLARLLKVQSPIGADLDSLADVVSFGVAPAMSLYVALSGWVEPYGIATYGVFVLAAFAAVRLAKFNNDTRQSTSFIGLPVPANALFWIAYFYLCGLTEEPVITGLPLLALTLVLVCLFSYLMVCELPMLALKMKSMAWRGNEWRYILVIASAVFVALWNIGGFAPAIILYVLMALVARKRTQEQG